MLVMMAMMIMQAGVTSLLLILTIFCSAAWARAQRTVEGCGEGYWACTSGTCIHERYACDGGNDCGDNSDEDPDMCTENADLTCRPNYLPCPGGWRSCVYYAWLCNGNEDCRDKSDETAEVCQSHDAVIIRNCTYMMMPACVTPIYSEINALGSVEALVEKILTTNLREICEPVLQAQECVLSELRGPCSIMLDTESFPQIPHMRSTLQQMREMNITVNYICRNNVDVFEQHKQCLLRYDNHQLVLIGAVFQQCGRLLTGPSSPCPPPEFVDCAQNVIVDQCGEEIAQHLRTLVSQLLEELDCTSRKLYRL